MRAPIGSIMGGGPCTLCSCTPQMKVPLKGALKVKLNELPEGGITRTNSGKQRK